MILSRFIIYNSHFTWIYITRTAVTTSLNAPQQQWNNSSALYYTTFLAQLWET
jgi:hypothetical protein